MITSSLRKYIYIFPVPFFSEKGVIKNIDIIDIKYQNLVNSDRENIYELQKKFNDCVNNIKNIESIINNQQNIINNQNHFTEII